MSTTLSEVPIATCPAAGAPAPRPRPAGPPPAAASPAPERRYDLDWLRVLAFLLLVPFHAGMFFVTWDWHVKNPELTDGALEVVMFFMSQWRLPLLFFVSGAGVWYALRRRTAGAFARERLRRLLLPLGFGMLVVVPPQVYYERLSQGAGYASYLHFLPDAFRGVYPEGNLSWHHLWFVAYVLVYALVALPLFLYLRSAAGQAALARRGALARHRGALLLLAAPVMLSEVLLRPHWPSSHNLVADWANLVSFFFVFVAGYVVCGANDIGEAVRAQRRYSFAVGTAASALLIGIWQLGLVAAPGDALQHALWSTVSVLSGWAWVLALAGYARHYLNVRSRAIALANEAVYPFYILHQTVTVALAYHLGPWSLGIGAKLLLLCAGTYLVTAALYLAIRAHPLTRLLFGMKPAARPEPAPAPVAVRA